MIDINELRRKVNSTDVVDHIDLHANIRPIISELLDRLEAAEKAVNEAYQRGYATGQEEIEKERYTLRAKIKAMERQRPVRLVFRSDELDEQIRRATDPAWAEKIEVPGGMVALYALPGAKGE